MASLKSFHVSYLGKDNALEKLPNYSHFEPRSGRTQQQYAVYHRLSQYIAMALPQSP